MAAFTLSPAAPEIQNYYAKLAGYRKLGVTNELAIRQAFVTLLENVSKNIAWPLLLEQTLANRARPDGVLLDNLRIPRGYWEAKDPKEVRQAHLPLEIEITQKIAVGYPTFNTIFENSAYGVLYQDGKHIDKYDLRHKEQLAALLSRFFTYTGADLQKFQAAVREFQARIPLLAQGLIHRIDAEFKQNVAFNTAFQKFQTLCQQALHKETSREVVAEMLVQHLLTERLFRTVFDNADFVRRNVIAAEIEKVIETLTNRTFKRSDFLGDLKQIYQTLEDNAKRIEDFSAKQPFLNVVYERFFQGFSVKQADTHGIIYTPQPIVDFMWNSVETILQQEFNLTLAAPTVQILDPCVGTGNFILNLLNRLSRKDLQRKYENEIFCNEVLLLSYYIATLNIEYCYFERMKQYLAYPGLRLVDTLNSSEVHDERGQTEPAPLMVIIGNPPYNVGQQNENDNNKNRKYAVIDRRVRETYAKDSRASNKNALSDAYVKFFRWAIDRLDGRDGIICFVSNNSFVDQIAFDGMRKHLLQDFTQIYHLDLHGNVRQNPKLSGTKHNVFGIQVGVGITIAIRNRSNPARFLRYFRLPEIWDKEEKYAFLAEKGAVCQIAWQELHPNAKDVWLTEGLHAEFDTFIPMGTKEAKARKSSTGETIFKSYGRGVATSRDNWAYNFNETSLIANIQCFSAAYNAEVDRWQQRSQKDAQVDAFVSYDDTKLKWSEGLKNYLARGILIDFDTEKVRSALYRPFCKQYLYFDRFMAERVYQFPNIFPTPASETENLIICVNGIGSKKKPSCLITSKMVDLGIIEATQCFPFYTYAEDGRKRQENITDWAVKQFEAKYGPDPLVELAETSAWPWPELAEGNGLQIDSAKKAIFFYVYALLQHPLYRERYKENLKRELPRLPLVGDRQTFLTLVDIGQKLADLHLNYETVEEYPLEWVENQKVPWTWRVEKMKLTKAKDAIIVNRCLTLKGLPASAFEYQLGHRSALEWVLDQYQITPDQRSGITNDPNRAEEPQYIVRMIGKVLTVSVETVKLVALLNNLSLDSA